MTVPTYFYQNCPVCGRPLRIPVQWLGQRVRCRHCRGTLQARMAPFEVNHFEANHAVLATDRNNRKKPEDAQLADNSILLVMNEPESLQAVTRYLTNKGHFVSAVHPTDGIIAPQV